jgi:hypothetical protein
MSDTDRLGFGRQAMIAVKIPVIAIAFIADVPLMLATLQICPIKRADPDIS